MTKPSSKSGAERQAALRFARRRQGLKEVRNLWCHPEDEASLKAYASQLASQRRRPEEQE